MATAYFDRPHSTALPLLGVIGVSLLLVILTIAVLLTAPA
jgi:hypothetical protein